MGWVGVEKQGKEWMRVGRSGIFFLSVGKGGRSRKKGKGVGRN